MKNKIEYQRFKVGNKEIKSNLSKGILNNENIKQIEDIIEETRKKLEEVKDCENRN